MNLSIKQECHCREPDMWVRPYINTLAGRKLSWTHVIEEYARADGSPFGVGEGSADLEAPDVSFAR
jgi:hypothetical protein